MVKMETSIEIDKEKRLFDAVSSGDFKQVFALVEEGIDLNFAVSVNFQNRMTSVLQQAVLKNRVDIVELLLQHSADPNIVDEEGETPLFSAIHKDLDPKIQTLLCQYGASVNQRNKAGNTPLMYLALFCMEFGGTSTDETIFRLLSGCEDITQRNSRDQEFIHLIPFVHNSEQKLQATEHICVRYLKHLTARGVSVNTKDGTSLTPLHYACLACCSKAAFFLVDVGADVSAKSTSGQSVVHLLGKNSDRSDFQKILNFLLEKGCSLQECDNLGRNILHYITSSNAPNRAALKAVVQYGLDVNKKDGFGLSPLHLSTIPSVFLSCDEIEDDEDKKVKVSDTIQTLVENGANINIIDANQLTALHYALRYETKGDLVKTILLSGSDVTLKSKTGDTALHRATLYPNLLDILLQYIKDSRVSIDINSRDNFGSTALHWAINYFEPRCVEMLLKFGADLTIKDDHGQTAVEFAISAKRTELFDVLGITECKKTSPLPYDLNVATIGQASENSIPSFTRLPLESSEKYLDDVYLRAEEFFEKHPTVLTEAIRIVSEISIDEGKEIAKNETDDSEDNCVEIEETESDHTEEDENAENELQCIGVDNMWCDCPLLQEVYYTNGNVDMNNWEKHLAIHRRSLAAYMRHIINAKQMGLYHHTVENEIVAQQIEKVMEYLATELKKRSPILEFSLKLAGSWAEGTKLVYPEEFDYNLVLVNFNLAFKPVEVEEKGLNSFAKLILLDQYRDTELLKYVDDTGALDSRKVVRDLYTNLNEILTGLPNDILGQLYLVKYLKTEKGSIDNLSFRWVSTTYKNMLIDVDIVPTVIPISWSPSCICTSRCLLTRMSKIRCSVVLKTPSSRFASKWNNLLRISVADTEIEIFKSTPPAVLKGYILIKSLFHTLYFPQIKHQDTFLQTNLTTYVVKTCFLYVLESIIAENGGFGEQNYEQSAVAISIAFKILQELEKAVFVNGALESFFIPGVNLLANESLISFNKSELYECEVRALKALLCVGYMEFKKQKEGQFRKANQILKLMW